MIIGIGIDTVEIDRFKHWHTYSPQKLSRIFSPQEISYCLQSKQQSAARFAVRFAAKEAFFKAFSTACPTQKTPFLKACRYLQILKKNDLPFMQVDWENIENPLEKPPYTLLSMSHSKTIANAIVLLQVISMD